MITSTPTLLLVFSLMLLLPPASRAGDGLPVYKDLHAPVEKRVADVLRRLNTAEKIAMLSGATPMTLVSNERLGLPSLKFSDGPDGVRCYGKSTAYPGGLILAATWDPALAESIGASMGRDCRARGVHVLLAPGMNLYRAPMGGRNFEFYGEDPLLAGSIAAGFVRGVQSQGVAATAKHFLCNEQEYDRHDLSSNADERTLRELYLKPFKMCVDAGVWCVMDSYNPLNGIHASQNGWINNIVLKGEWKFHGYVMSDWESCYDTLGMANGGLDLEMPGGKFFNPGNLMPLIESDEVKMAAIDDKVRRQLRVAFSMGWYDRPQEDAGIPRDDPRADALALEGARAGIILLKNEGGLLPLDRAKVKRIALVGPNADAAMTGGAGSSFVTPFHAVSLAQGLEAAARGVEIARVSSTGARIGDEAAIRQADCVVIAAGFQYLTSGAADANDPASEGEGADRPYALPPHQAELVKAVAALNPRVVVVLNSGGSVESADWLGSVPALIHAFYPGQQGGTALAEILFGDVNPSGRLPFSWEKKWEDCAAYGNYPTQKEPHANTYKEGVFLGYRWFDAKGVEPLFPFGYGLGYTTFRFEEVKASVASGNVTAIVKVTNTGSRPGAETVQCYVEPPKGKVPRPVRELRGFAKVTLQAGETKSVRVPLDGFAYWDPELKKWTVTPGEYTVSAGGSSRDLPVSAKVKM